MSSEGIPESIRYRYREAGLRGTKISRLEERRLGQFSLDPETAWELGRDNLGVFIGGCDSLERTIELLRTLKQPSPAPHWIVACASKDMACLFVRQWCQMDERSWVTARKLSLPQNHGNVVLATPESLPAIGGAERNDVAALILVDMLCHIHKARGIRKRDFVVQHDRPQLVADFRNVLGLEDWLPPLILLAKEPAKSIATDPIARAYCLEGWRFVDGATMRWGPRVLPPVVTR
jgi:hypothetical protein